MSEFRIAISHTANQHEDPKTKDRFYKTFINDINAAKEIIATEFEASNVTLSLVVTWEKGGE